FWNWSKKAGTSSTLGARLPVVAMGGGVSAGPGVGSSPAGVSGGAEGFSSTPMDGEGVAETGEAVCVGVRLDPAPWSSSPQAAATTAPETTNRMVNPRRRSEEHTSELQSP